MPIYEYLCQDCQTAFELIRSYKDADSGLTCSQCNSDNIIRKISLFNATSSGRTIGGSSACGSCAGGSCGSCGSQ